jgi:hypothetical protein
MHFTNYGPVLFHRFVSDRSEAPLGFAAYRIFGALSTLQLVLLPRSAIDRITRLGDLVEPSNDHELAIKCLVDRNAVEGTLSPLALPELAEDLSFLFTRTDSEFLVKYIRWRLDNPILR